METDSTRRRLIQAVCIVGVLVLAVLVPLALSKGDGTFGGFLHSANVTPRQSLVEAAIRSKANDPGSVTFEKIRYGWRIRKQGEIRQYVFVAYRDRSPFGGPVYLEQVLRIVDDRRVDWLIPEEQMSSAVDLHRWTEDPAGPAGRPD